MATKRFAVIRVRGFRRTMRTINDTMSLLRLYRTHNCVVIDDRDTYKGMIKKAKDYITFGDINEETFTELLRKRGRVTGDQPVTDAFIKEHSNSKFKTIDEFAKAFMSLKAEFADVEGLRPIFRLRSPRKGWEKLGKRNVYSCGGALGYRGEDVNELIRRMM